MTSGRPTAELAAKHEIAAPRVDETAFRPAWRIVTQLDKLYTEKRIGIAALFAGRRWRRDWEAAMGRSRGARSIDAPRGGGGSGALPHLAAASRLRVVEAVLGASAANTLKLVLVDDLPWTQLGARLGLADKAAKARAIQLLEALAAVPAPNPALGRP